MSHEQMVAAVKAAEAMSTSATERHSSYAVKGWRMPAYRARLAGRATA